MTPTFPIDAEEIHIKWQIEGGGLGVTAFTDEAGLPYIGLYPLNWAGEPTGLPSRFQRIRLMADVVVGFVERKPIVVFIDAEVTQRGLELRLCLPLHMAKLGHPRYLSARWGGEKPIYRMRIFPANTNWVINPSPIEREAR